jgi:hypothetical protein
MTDDNQKLIAELVTMPHFYALKALLDERLAKVKDITQLDRSDPNFTAQAMGKSIAYETIYEMLADIGLYENPGKPKRNTYE